MDIFRYVVRYLTDSPRLRMYMDVVSVCTEFSTGPMSPSNTDNLCTSATTIPTKRPSPENAPIEYTCMKCEQVVL